MTGPPETVPHEVPGSRSASAATHVEERKDPARTRVRFPAPPHTEMSGKTSMSIWGVDSPRVDLDRLVEVARLLHGRARGLTRRI